MPLITFESGTLSEEIKKELITKLTEVSATVTGIPKEAFFIALRELPDTNIAVGGKTVAEMKQEFAEK